MPPQKEMGVIAKSGSFHRPEECVCWSHVKNFGARPEALRRKGRVGYEKPQVHPESNCQRLETALDALTGQFCRFLQLGFCLAGHSEHIDHQCAAADNFLSADDYFRAAAQ